MNNRKNLTCSVLMVLLTTVLLFVGIGAYGCVAPNYAPEIISLEAGEMEIEPSWSTIIVCQARDEDGDELFYKWTANDGKITNIDQEEASVFWTAPKKEGLYNITVLVSDGQERDNSEVSDSITIKVKERHPPVIVELIADVERVSPSGSCQITCIAEDMDGDELGYKWGAQKGTISGTGNTVEWKAPALSGLYEIIVIVSNSYGKRDTETIIINVSQDPASVTTDLIIEDLIIRADHKYLKETSYGYQAGKASDFYIECIVSDQSDELVYEWSCSCDEDKIIGDSPMIIWTSPNKSVRVTITVTVSNPLGDAASKDVILQIVSCSPCTFGG